MLSRRTGLLFGSDAWDSLVGGADSASSVSRNRNKLGKSSSGGAVDKRVAFSLGTGVKFAEPVISVDGIGEIADAATHRRTAPLGPIAVYSLSTSYSNGTRQRDAAIRFNDKILPPWICRLLFSSAMRLRLLSVLRNRG
jgi:hypothetical protein